MGVLAGRVHHTFKRYRVSLYELGCLSAKEQRLIWMIFWELGVQQRWYTGHHLNHHHTSPSSDWKYLMSIRQQMYCLVCWLRIIFLASVHKPFNLEWSGRYFIDLSRTSVRLLGVRNMCFSAIYALLAFFHMSICILSYNMLILKHNIKKMCNWRMHLELKTNNPYKHNWAG